MELPTVRPAMNSDVRDNQQIQANKKPRTSRGFLRADVRGAY